MISEFKQKQEINCVNNFHSHFHFHTTQNNNEKKKDPMGIETEIGSRKK